MKPESKPGKPWRKWLPPLVVLLAPVVPLGYKALQNPGGLEEMLSPGPLLAGHQDLTCGNCHTEAWRGARHALARGDRLPDAMDGACAGCHGGLEGDHCRSRLVRPTSKQAARPPAVKPHNDCQILADVGHCLDCHREHHKGPTTYAPDAACTRCHENLKTRPGTSTRFARHLTAFAIDHPPFGQWRPGGLVDPGQLHFNHAVHLHLRPDELRGTAGPLQCLSCHDLEPSGHYFRPISYPQHCAACHPLSVQLVGTPNGRRAEEAARGFGRETVPHGEQPAVVQGELRRRLSTLATSYPELLVPETVEPGRRLPGKPLPPPGPNGIVPWVERQLEAVGRQLFALPGGCRKCHIDEAPVPLGTQLPRFRPTSLPRRWFPHAQFNHATHEVLDCKVCHAALNSTRTSDVLMPALGICVRCHHHGTDSSSHARADCLLCHPYHRRSGSEAGHAERRHSAAGCRGSPAPEVRP
jgi:Cytochrome c7 and related cytochrome c